MILSKISNAILAHNQRQLFAKLMSESVGFFSERHSSEFLARMTAGAKSITDLLNMLINAIGRDFLILIAMIAVMVSQDPILSLIGLVAVPPAMLMLRKLVKRIKGLAHTQFTGTASIMETMQESLQGIRTVKAFTLEGAMQKRIDGNIAAVERNANKMARVSNRSNPLMEMLGGFAVAGCLLYAGYSVVALECDTRSVLLLHDRLPDGDRTGQTSGAAQHRPEQPTGRRAHAAGSDRQPGHGIGRRRQAGA